MAERIDRTSTLPVAGRGDSNTWRDFIETERSPRFVLNAAEVLAGNQFALIDPIKDRPDNCDLDRVQLIFCVFERFFVLESQKTEIRNGWRRMDTLLDILIQNASLCELIELGDLLYVHKKLFPTDMWHRKIRKIFETLKAMENIEEISQGVEIRKSGIDNW